MLAIIDYGMGNLRSVKNMLRYLGYESIISCDVEDIHKADKLILPGVGNFSYAMENIEKLGIKPELDKSVLIDKKPVLGICLGMQLLTTYSEEGNCNGLNYIPANTVKFDAQMMDGRKIPHMGWNNLNIVNNADLTSDITLTDRFYFVHSYYVKCNDQINCIANTKYGIDFNSVIGNENVLGAQFHPEKSLRFGMKILSNFMEKY